MNQIFPMPTVAAIDISALGTRVVLAAVHPNSSLEVLETHVISALPHAEGAHSEEADPAVSDLAGSAVPVPEFESHPALEIVDSDSPPEEAIEDIEEFSFSPFDSCLAIISSDEVIYKQITLPFDDPKKIDQVAPLQIQDKLPFEIQEFLVDNLVLRKNDSGQFEVISSLLPEASLQYALEELQSHGFDPRIITTRESSLAALYKLAQSELPENCAIILFDELSTSLAIFVEGRASHFRSLNPYLDTTADKSGFMSKLISSVAFVEKSKGIEIRDFFVLGLTQISQLQSRLPDSVIRPFPLSSFLDSEASMELLAAHAWSLGLFAQELQLLKRDSTKIVDFRKGPYAFRAPLRDFFLQLRMQLLPIGLAIFFGVLWLGLTWYGTEKELALVDESIKKVVHQIAPGETIIKGAELSSLTERVEELDSQLKGIASLSSLSPLEWLREITLLVEPKIGLEIDSLKISGDELTFRGSVGSIENSADLITALKSKVDRFCLVEVTPEGTVGTSARRKVNGKIGLCKQGSIEQ